MKTSRICAAVLGTLATFATGHALADEGERIVTVLDTFSTVWVKGDALGPTVTGFPRLEKNTGAGIMDANFTFDRAAAKANPGEVLLGTAYTRSSLTPNNAQSYMQGGFALAKLTSKGVELGRIVDFPDLNGERAFMRPLMGFTAKYVVVIAASEDNGRNNNPQPVMFLADKATGALVQIPNSTRTNKDITKPTNLIDQALADGIKVDNPGAQRGPHSIVPVGYDSFVVGMQYNNNAAEAFKVTVAGDGTVKMDWLKRYSNTAQHCRPQVAIVDGANAGYLAAVEANGQPAEIGLRLTKFNVTNGEAILSKIAIASDPKAKKYVAEPSIGIVGDKIAVGYGMGTPTREKAANANGHAGGSHVAMLALFNTTDLGLIGEPLANAAPFGRHAHIFATQYGPAAEPAIAYIGGSSTGTKGGFEQLFRLNADGTLGPKDTAQLFAVSTYSDVGNVQARGKRNPQNQAKGFINGLGGVANPGFGKGPSAFMPEVKAFSFSTITGYSDGAAEKLGKRDSIWLSLVPAAWQDGLKVIPGSPTDKPGGNSGGTGPAVRQLEPPATAAQPGEAGAPLGAGTADGCSVSRGGSATSEAELILIAIAGVLVAFRRRRQLRETQAAFLVGLTLASVSAVAGCTSEDSDSLNSRRAAASEVNAAQPMSGADAGSAPEPGKLPSGTKEGEAFFATEVHPLFKTTCAGCHAAGGIGSPTWIDGNDPKKSYDMIYLQAYATADSRIIAKGAHSSGGAPPLTPEQKTKWAAWMSIEAKTSGKPTQANILAKFGECFDKAKFDAIGFEELRVTARQANNNPQSITEDQNTCTGCRDKTACSTCHAADDVTGFVMAIGNTVLPSSYTFESTKKSTPPFIRQYVGTTPTGEPTYNPGIKTKSVHTIQNGVAYGHPMFELTPKMELAIKAFVEDAIAKRNAGSCGK